LIRRNLFVVGRIPMSDKYKIHKAFDRQIQALGGTSFSNYFKDLRTKGTRTHEGEVSSLIKYIKRISSK
jgi:hypothetical protein